jgi:hypothetical protein
MPGIKRVSVKHEAILHFLLANPNIKMGQVAEHFQVSRPWLSLIIHSDAFQRKLRERQDVHFHSSILPMMERMHLVTEKAIDRMLDLVPMESDLGKLNQVVDKALNRFGYGTSSSPAAQVNVQVNVDAQALARARQLIGARSQALEVITSEVGCTEALPALGACELGQDDSASALPLESTAYSAGAAGDPI